MKLKLLQIKEPTGKEVMKSAELIAEMMAEEGKADRECLWVIHLNCGLKVIEKELAHMGTLTEAAVSCREIFRKAVINSTAFIVTVHNHPSGNSEPSFEDKTLWDRLAKAGDILGITITDNLIITPNGSYYSQCNDTREQELSPLANVKEAKK